MKINIFYVFLIGLFFSACNSHTLEVYVAPNGNDASRGTKSQPFATLEKARDFVRENKVANQEIIVYLREGNYQLEETLVFRKEDSAPEGGSITNVSYRQ